VEEIPKYNPQMEVTIKNGGWRLLEMLGIIFAAIDQIMCSIQIPMEMFIHFLLMAEISRNGLFT
jgi:hypothetical protein